jgi:hypothetical protein
MRIGGWRWILASVVVVVAGCLPHPTTDWPASFTEQYGGAEGQSTFTAQAPPIGQTGQPVADALRVDATTPMFMSRALPVFGVIACTGVPDCQPGPGGFPGGPPRTVWVIIYPDWVGADGDPGWVLVDAVAGTDAGYEYVDPRGR